MKRVHPADPSVAYSWTEWESWCQTQSWLATKVRRVWDECVEEDMLMMAQGKRVHPLGNGTSYTFLQTHEFCNYDVQAAKALWQEMRVASKHEAPDFGRWTPVNTMPTSKFRVYHPSDVHWDEPRKLVRRAWSEGQLMELPQDGPLGIGREPSRRHPDGHPTARAYDASWVAAT